MSDALLVGIDDVRAAAARLQPYLRETPCEESAWLSAIAGAPVFVKWESLQPTGSFKVRGALHKLLRLRERGVTRVLAVSAGNHGQGVAHAARLLGMEATVVVPESAAPTKVQAIQRYGVELLARGRDYDAAETEARALAETRGVEFVSPYNDPDVIAGQGTAVLELCAVCPFETLVVPVGGGGLLAGAAIAARALRPDAAIVGAQPAGAPAMHAALAAGAIVPVDEEPTCADGLSGNLEAGSITVPIAQALVDRVALVAEASIERAIRGFLAGDHMVVEGSGAVGAALVIEAGNSLFRPGPIALLATGRNIDLGRLEGILQRT